MITAGINLLILSVFILIVGLIKPKWLLMWVDNPGRMPIIMIAGVLFMIGMTLFGEGNKRKHEALVQQSEQPVKQAEPAEHQPAEKGRQMTAQELIKN